MEIFKSAANDSMGISMINSGYKSNIAYVARLINRKEQDAFEELNFNGNQSTNFVNERINAAKVCNSFEQDARRYKRYLGDDGKAMYK